MPKIEISESKGLVQKTGTSGGGGAGLKLLAENNASAELKVIQADVTVASGQTTGKSSAKVVPAGFVALACNVRFTVASANNVNLVDIGTDADPDCFVDGVIVRFKNNR
jgi:hypothetical protein